VHCDQLKKTKLEVAGPTAVANLKRMAHVLKQYGFFWSCYFMTIIKKRDPTSLLMHVTIWL
jgi:hypothetical protein